MKKNFLIWDLPLRLFHWSFAASIMLLWLTSELGTDYIDWHLKLGYFVLTLVSFRLVWGFVGPQHARFFSFFPTPRKVISYLKNKDQKYAGHNPVGSLMVFAMLLLVLVQGVSGLFVDDEVFTSGPYFNSAGAEIDSLMRTLHFNTFDFILAAIALHIAAIAFYKIIKKQNLTKAMITGQKSSQGLKESDEIPHSKLIVAFIVAILACTFIYWLVVINPPPLEEFYY